MLPAPVNRSSAALEILVPSVEILPMGTGHGEETVTITWPFGWSCRESQNLPSLWGNLPGLLQEPGLLLHHGAARDVSGIATPIIGTLGQGEGSWQANASPILSVDGLS